MLLEDLYTDQIVGIVATRSHVKQGLIGKVIGYSNKYQQALVELPSSGRVYVNLKDIIGLL